MATLSQNVSGVALLPIFLTANLTNLTLTDAQDGQTIILEFIQDGTGSRTVTSASIPSLALPAQAANAVSFVELVFNQSKNIWVPLNSAVTGGVSQAFTATGAIAATSGIVTLGGSGVDAMTLVAPPADGITLYILVTTAHAHTITTPANLINGVADTITFTAVIGNNATLVSANGVWYMIASQGATLSEV
jgi:hypothetical protein